MLHYATLGYAGHSKCILKKLKKGHLFAFDKDLDALTYSKQELQLLGKNFTLIHDNFENMEKCLEEKGI